MNLRLILDNRMLPLDATALYEDERPLFLFDEWKNDDFYYVIIHFKEPS